jgi:hypothetical protein
MSRPFESANGTIAMLDEFIDGKGPGGRIDGGCDFAGEDGP